MQAMATIVAASSAAPDGSALALARLPYVFTQDQLLRTDDFIKEAVRRGHQLNLDILSDLHSVGMLKPMFRISDVAAVGRRIDAPHPGDMNARGWFFDAAASGRLRDVTCEGRSVWEPYRRPTDEPDHRWWNGFLYSSWQLTDVARALSDYRFHRHGWTSSLSRTRSDRALPRMLALCALGTRHLPAILGTFSSPGGYDDEALWRSRFDIDDRERLKLVGFNPTDLRGHAEQLLAEAKGSDPMIEWLPLLRHASNDGWNKLKGAALDAHEKRLAAEVLLRAHEELALKGDLEALPELGPQGWWTPLHDRLTARGPAADSLDRALGTFGLSPYPRVLLLVEGETEMVHLPRLLDVYGLNRSDKVRIQNLGGSRVSPQLIARYAVSPRLGPSWGGYQFLSATPTALVIAMDPENKWATEADRASERRKMHTAIREEVQRQGADITDQDLDYLVRVFVWGEHSYEFANFTDEELVEALVVLATEQGIPEADTEDWRARATQEFQSARSNKEDARAPIGRMKVRANKPRLADILWPSLLDAIENAEGSQTDLRPVHELLGMVRQIASSLSGSGYVLEQPSPTVSND